MNNLSKIATPDVAVTRKKARLWNYLKGHLWLYFMVLPGLLALILFSYMPMYGIVVAFQDFNIFEGYWGSPWAGLTHFKTMFNDPYFFRLLRNTIRLGATDFLVTFPAPIILALIINECRLNKYKKVVQSISYLPHFIPMVIMVGIMYELFSSYGIVNAILNFFGVDSISFFSRTEWFYPLYIGSSVWKGIGWGSIIYMGALTGVDSGLYEAAELDGANRWERMIHITLPCIKPTIVTLFILDIGGIMKVGFEKVFLLSSPATYEVADVLSTYVYRQGILNANYSYNAAVDLFNNVVAVIFVLSANWFAKKMGEEGIV